MSRSCDGLNNKYVENISFNGCSISCRRWMSPDQKLPTVCSAARHCEDWFPVRDLCWDERTPYLPYTLAIIWLSVKVKQVI